jgi:hypothetical protein
MNKEQMLHLIKLVKNTADNNLILLKALIELKCKVEQLEKLRKKERSLMLFKRNDKIAIVVKPKTHNGFVNDK